MQININEFNIEKSHQYLKKETFWFINNEIFIKPFVTHPIDLSDHMNLTRLAFLNYKQMSKYRQYKYYSFMYMPYTFFESKSNNSIIIQDNFIRIVFGYSFNTVVKLPNFLIDLCFGYDFNQQIELPKTLLFLSFDVEFNQQIILPDIKKLIIDSDNEHIINNLPNSLETLVLGYEFNLQLNYLPDSIKHITIQSMHSEDLNNLPISLESMFLVADD